MRGEGCSGKCCYFPTQLLRIISKREDLFYKKGNNFQENSAFNCTGNCLNFFFEKLDFPLKGKGILGLEEK